MSLIHNEQTKLTAGALDRISTAAIAIGVIAPVVAATFGAPGYSGRAALILFSGGWFVVGIGLHLLGRAILRRLIP